MSKPHKFASGAEKQADYRARKKIENEQLRKIAENTRIIVSAARVSGLASDTMTEVRVLERVAGYLMEDMSHEEVVRVFLNK
jgi:hypothetical protein